MKKFIFCIVCASLSSSLHAALDKSTLTPHMVPAPLIQAMNEIHQSAKSSELRSLFMFNYVYFNSGFCKDQDCSPELVSKEIEKWKNLMGEEFAELNKKYHIYKKEIEIEMMLISKGDLQSLIAGRHAHDILARKVFLTCIDYAKAIASRAIEYGLDETNLRFFWTMGTEAYFKMCPTREGQKARPPRPLVHTIVAYKHRGHWYAMNSENPNPEIIPLGKNLPNRLELEFIFSRPSLVSGVPLIFAGHYSFNNFINGFGGQTILNITASGEATADESNFKCL